MATTGEKKQRRKRGALTTEEKVAAVALAKTGELSPADVANALQLPVKQVKELLDEARAVIDANAVEYARLHFQAAQNAALKGRSGPMEWALERLGVVKPPQPENTGPKGMVIKIGIVLPGLGSGATLATEVVDAETSEPS
jgi:hypothetical protein